MGSRRKGNKAIGYLTQSMRWWYRRRKGGIIHPPTHTPTMAKSNEIYVSDQSDQSFWYFAYGSNMRLSTMTGRGITPLTKEVVEVTTHYLTFDIFGIPYSEPSYASIAEFPSTGTVSVSSPSGFGTRQVPAVVGVAYLISAKDRHRLLVSEGSGVVYDWIQVDANILHSQSSRKTIPVWTLRAKHPLRPNGVPSARYVVYIFDFPSPILDCL